VVGAPDDALVEQTGWATGPDDDLRSVLRPMAGSVTQDEVRAPADTAFTHWASVPRLVAPASASVYAAMLALTATAAPGPKAQVTANTVEITLPDGVITRIGFGPLSVSLG
jgi:hypothetical protein